MGFGVVVIYSVHGRFVLAKFFPVFVAPANTFGSGWVELPWCFDRLLIVHFGLLSRDGVAVWFVTFDRVANLVS